ncbi:hypothetical protein YQE_02259, partial [Dendroctonus ponderosae]
MKDVNVGINLALLPERKTRPLLYLRKLCHRDACYNPSCSRRRSFRDFSQNHPDNDGLAKRKPAIDNFTATSESENSCKIVHSLSEAANSLKPILKRHATADKCTLTIHLDENGSRNSFRLQDFENPVDIRLSNNPVASGHCKNPNLPVRSKSCQHLPNTRQFVHGEQQSSFSVFDDEEDIEELISIHAADFLFEEDDSKYRFGFSANGGSILEAIHVRLDVDKERLFQYLNRTCFRVFLGPSIDETTVLTMENFIRFLQWCGFLNV